MPPKNGLGLPSGLASPRSVSQRRFDRPFASYGPTQTVQPPKIELEALQEKRGAGVSDDFLDWYNPDAAGGPTAAALEAETASMASAAMTVDLDGTQAPLQRRPSVGADNHSVNIPPRLRWVYLSLQILSCTECVLCRAVIYISLNSVHYGASQRSYRSCTS